jgi:YVTN family beta-propeller protein
VSVINLATNTVTATITVGDSSSGIAVDPAGTFAYVANYDDDSVSVIDLSDNTVLTPTIAVGAGPFSIVVNPAGTFAYVANDVGDSVSVITLDATVPGVPTGVSAVGGN